MITIKLSWNETIALPENIKAADAAMLMQLLTQCVRVSRCYGSKSQETIDYVEPLEVTIKRLNTAPIGREQAEAQMKIIEAAFVAAAEIEASLA